MKFKHISIGTLINHYVTERGIEISRICNFMKCTQEEVQHMYQEKSMDTEVLLKWSKLLEYDFFRLYSQHLILYAPAASDEKIEKQHNRNTILPRFRKNIYTREIINFILGQISSGEMTKTEVMERYKIPKTTLYKWIEKYETGNENKK